MTPLNIKEIKKALDTHGYCLIKDFLSMDEFSSLLEYTNQLEAMPEIIGGPMKYFEHGLKEGSEMLNRIEKFLDENHQSDNHLLLNKLPNLLQQVFNEKFNLFKEKINFKMPGGNGFKPHQDAPAFTRFTKNEMFTFMIPLQETTQENGCLQITPNYFEKSTLKHENGVVIYPKNQKITWEPITMETRDILVFSSMLIHQSDRNLSKEPRRVHLITYNKASDGNLRNEYFEYKRSSFPPRIERSDSNNTTEWTKNLGNRIF